MYKIYVLNHNVFVCFVWFQEQWENISLRSSSMIFLYIVTENSNRNIYQFLNTLETDCKISKRPVKILVFLKGSWLAVSILPFSSKQPYTLSFVCNKCFEFVLNKTLKFELSEFQWGFFSFITYYVTKFCSWHLNAKLKNAPCADEYGVYTINTDVTSYVKCLQKRI